jgi:hypothetical protein
MRMISIVLALVITGASSRYTHEKFPTPFAAGIDLVMFIFVYLLVSRSIKAYLDE